MFFKSFQFRVRFDQDCSMRLVFLGVIDKIQTIMYLKCLGPDGVCQVGQSINRMHARMYPVIICIKTIIIIYTAESTLIPRRDVESMLIRRCVPSWFIK